MIKLMTYNIRGAKGMDDRRSAPRIAEVIRESGAQIVCLQEVHKRLPWSGFVDQPRLLSRKLGMQLAFGENLSIGIGGYGNAVLTSFEIVEKRSHFLPSEGEQRGVLEVIVRTPDGLLTVFCTHFGLDKDERVKQAKELTALMNNARAPKLVCGDFNEEADAAGVSELIGSVGLIDADSGGAMTFSSVNPRHRIDMILCDPSIEIRSIGVIETQASDHFPLMAELEIQGEER